MTRKNKVLLEVPLQGNMDFCLVLSAYVAYSTISMPNYLSDRAAGITLVIMVLNN